MMVLSRSKNAASMNPMVATPRVPRNQPNGRSSAAAGRRPGKAGKISEKVRFPCLGGGGQGTHVSKAQTQEPPPLRPFRGSSTPPRRSPYHFQRPELIQLDDPLRPLHSAVRPGSLSKRL